MKKLLLDSRLKRTITANASPGAKQRRGSYLIESTVSLFLLVTVAIVLVDASFNILRPRMWTMRTNLVDAYLSQEVAKMNQVDFDLIVNGTSGWGSGSTTVPAAANAVVANNVEMGRMPGFTGGTGNGRPYTATVHRTRIPIETSTTVPTFDLASGETSLSLADMGIRCYELQTHVVYDIEGVQHVKTRSVIRTQ